LISGVDTIEAERLIEKMQALVEAMRQTMAKSEDGPQS
jgi:ABC-type Fe3+-hydroxamate transport system substrate-binding protein